MTIADKCIYNYIKALYITCYIDISVLLYITKINILYTISERLII